MDKFFERQLETVKKRVGRNERMRKLEKRRKYYAADAERRERQREATPNVAYGSPNPAEPEASYRRWWVCVRCGIGVVVLCGVCCAHAT